MRYMFRAVMFAASLFAVTQVNAQERKETVAQKVDKTAKKVGHKTSEVAAKGAAAVVDKKYDHHFGPNGEAVYINDHSAYYYVNKKGHRVYLKKSQLHYKPM